MIVRAELGKAAPVAQCQFGRIAHALAALLRRVDKEHAAETLARQSAE